MIDQGEDFIVDDLVCSQCGKVTVVSALGAATLPNAAMYIGPCCRRYIGELEWEEE